MSVCWQTDYVLSKMDIQDKNQATQTEFYCVRLRKNTGEMEKRELVLAPHSTFIPILHVYEGSIML